ncbi:DUF4350 domain-containing protein [soil metagenome]
MKQKLFIFIFLILMAAILVGLNAASFTQKEKLPDNEFMPNRSTFNSGATGTQAFYSLLSETGRKVVRWQDSPAALLTAKANKPAVFVITGRIRQDFTEPEIDDLMRWVFDGGRLVVFDRQPPEGLIATTSNWDIAMKESEDSDVVSVDPTDEKKMIGEAVVARAVQPSLFAQNVNAIQPSRFAASIEFSPVAGEDKDAGKKTANAPRPKRPANPDKEDSSDEIAPIAYFSNGSKNLVVDTPYNNGRIVIVSDPFIISNGGISLVDNAQMAINLVTSGNGIVAFDEFHQGYGTDNNRFLQFFAGTPVIAIFLQAAVLVGFVFYSRSRRFARPVPESEPDRLSKLEYVAAMAELQSRTKSFDLAIENIYGEFRRRAARYFGLDNYSANSKDLAALIAERGQVDRRKIEETLFSCEEIVRGETTNAKEVLYLAGQLRAIEQKLGLTRAGKSRN